MGIIVGLIVGFKEVQSCYVILVLVFVLYFSDGVCKL